MGRLGRLCRLGGRVCLRLFPLLLSEGVAFRVGDARLVTEFQLDPSKCRPGPGEADRRGARADGACLSVRALGVQCHGFASLRRGALGCLGVGVPIHRLPRYRYVVLHGHHACIRRPPCRGGLVAPKSPFLVRGRRGGGKLGGGARGLFLFAPLPALQCKYVVSPHEPPLCGCQAPRALLGGRVGRVLSEIGVRQNPRFIVGFHGLDGVPRSHGLLALLCARGLVLGCGKVLRAPVAQPPVVLGCPRRRRIGPLLSGQGFCQMLAGAVGAVGPSAGLVCFRCRIVLPHAR